MVDFSNVFRIKKDTTIFKTKEYRCVSCNKKLGPRFLQTKRDRKRGRAWCHTCWKEKKKILKK